MRLQPSPKDRLEHKSIQQMSCQFNANQQNQLKQLITRRIGTSDQTANCPVRDSRRIKEAAVRKHSNHSEGSSRRQRQLFSHYLLTSNITNHSSRSSSQHTNTIFTARQKTINDQLMAKNQLGTSLTKKILPLACHNPNKPETLSFADKLDMATIVHDRISKKSAIMQQSVMKRISQGRMAIEGVNHQLQTNNNIENSSQPTLWHEDPISQVNLTILNRKVSNHNTISHSNTISSNNNNKTINTIGTTNNLSNTKATTLTHISLPPNAPTVLLQNCRSLFLDACFSRRKNHLQQLSSENRQFYVRLNSVKTVLEKDCHRDNPTKMHAENAAWKLDTKALGRNMIKITEEAMARWGGQKGPKPRSTSLKPIYCENNQLDEAKSQNADSMHHPSQNIEANNNRHFAKPSSTSILTEQTMPTRRRQSRLPKIL